MTFEEIENQLPNGTHDADLVGFSVDLARRTLTLDIDADMITPDADLPPGEPDTRRIRITVSGLCFFSMDPPDVAYKYTMHGAERLVDSESLTEVAFLSEDVTSHLPAGAFCQRLYLIDWNGFMVFAGTNASLEWLDGTAN